MAFRNVYVAGGNGIGYTAEVDSSGDYGSVSNNAYFKDLSLGTGGLIFYKGSTGTIYPMFGNPARNRDVRILGSSSVNALPASWGGFTNGVISVGDLTTLNAPIDISLLVTSPTSNLDIRMYLSFSASSVSVGSVLLGKMTLGPSTYRVGKFTRTLFAKPTYSYDGSGEASAYDVYHISYIYSTDISDEQTGATGGSASNGVIANTPYYYVGDEPNTYPQYLVIDIPNNAFAYNLNIQHGL